MKSEKNSILKIISNQENNNLNNENKIWQMKKKLKNDEIETNSNFINYLM